MCQKRVGYSGRHTLNRPAPLGGLSVAAAPYALNHHGVIPEGDHGNLGRDRSESPGSGFNIVLCLAAMDDVLTCLHCSPLSFSFTLTECLRIVHSGGYEICTNVKERRYKTRMVAALTFFRVGFGIFFLGHFLVNSSVRVSR